MNALRMAKTLRPTHEGGRVYRWEVWLWFSHRWCFMDRTKHVQCGSVHRKRFRWHWSAAAERGRSWTEGGAKRRVEEVVLGPLDEQDPYWVVRLP